MCAALRRALAGPEAVRRVIARPFDGVPGAFVRTTGRRDYTLAPPSPSQLELLGAAGVDVHGVGKAPALFAGVGFSAQHPGATNGEAIASVERLIGELDRGLVFANLIETDQVYGHRKDVAGFHRALQAIDASLGEQLPRLRASDLLIVTADHGVDPAHPGTDHTREHAPLLALTGATQRAREAGAFAGTARHDGPLADVGASVLRHLTGADAPDLPGSSFVG
jgi:phosphopentomutase